MSDSKIAGSIGQTSKTFYKIEDLVYAVWGGRIISQQLFVAGIQMNADPNHGSKE